MADAALVALLNETKLDRYTEILAAAGVGLSTVQQMTDKGLLRELGLALGPAAKLFAEAKRAPVSSQVPTSSATRELGPKTEQIAEPEPEPEMVVPIAAQLFDEIDPATLTWQQQFLSSVELCAECENQFSATQGRHDDDSHLWYCDWCWECFVAESGCTTTPPLESINDSRVEAVTSEVYVEVAQAPQVAIVRFEQYRLLLRALVDLLTRGPGGAKTKRRGDGSSKPLSERRGKKADKKAEKDAAKILSIFVFQTLAGGDSPRHAEQKRKPVELATALEQQGVRSTADNGGWKHFSSCDPLIPSNPQDSIAWPELERSFLQLLSEWWAVDAASEPARAGLQTWLKLLNKAAETVHSSVQSLRAEAAGGEYVLARLKHWEEGSDTIPLCVLECQWQQHTRRVSLSTQHLSLLKERFTRHAPSFANGSFQDIPGTAGAYAGPNFQINVSVSDDAHFRLRLYNMLVRYETLALGDQGTQGALPPRAFALLQERFGVRSELVSRYLRACCGGERHLFRTSRLDVAECCVLCVECLQP